MRSHAFAMLATLVVVLHAATASAAMVVQESFYIANPANPSMGEYAAGDIASSAVTNQNPSTIGSVGLAWQGSTGVIDAVTQGLTYPGASATGGGAQFLHTSTLSDSRSIKRALTADYDLGSSAYYIAGMMSFDANFSTATTATAYTSFTNTEDTYDNRLTTTGPGTIILGTQWGFQGDGAGGVNAMMRLRNTALNIENVVLASGVSPGTHQFVFKVEPNYAGGSPDRVTAWLNPVSLASETAAGAPTLSGVYSNWVPGGGTPSYIVDTLTLKGWDIGANAAVGFDEFRFGTSWESLFGAPEQHVGLRQGVDGYQHLGSELRENNLSFGAGSNSVILVGNAPGATVGKLRTVLGWDLSGIPEGAVITGASLTMTPATVDLTTAGSGVGEIELRRLVNTTPMVESEVDWQEISDGVSWDTDGGDLGSLLGVVDGFTVSNTDMTPRVFSTDELIAAVQDAFDSGTALEMILLSPSTESGSSREFVRWHSDDAATLAFRPLLTITYIPEPSGAMLLALAALAGLLVRRRR